MKVGPKTVYPNASVENGKEGFSFVVDDWRGVWLGYEAKGFAGQWQGTDGQYWTFIPWSSVRFVSYDKAEGDGPLAA